MTKNQMGRSMIRPHHPCPTRLASAGAFITAGPSLSRVSVSLRYQLGTACNFSHPTPRQYATPYGSRPRCFASSLGCLLQRTRIAPHSSVDTHAPLCYSIFLQELQPLSPKEACDVSHSRPCPPVPDHRRSSRTSRTPSFSPRWRAARLPRCSLLRSARQAA